eukprot:4436833-Pleurochrysis_carterae.AAC.3
MTFGMHECGCTRPCSSIALRRSNAWCRTPAERPSSADAMSDVWCCCSAAEMAAVASAAARLRAALLRTEKVHEDHDGLHARAATSEGERRDTRARARGIARARGLAIRPALALALAPCPALRVSFAHGVAAGKRVPSINGLSISRPSLGRHHTCET